MLLLDQKVFELMSVSQRFYFLSDKKYLIFGFANIYEFCLVHASDCCYNEVVLHFVF